MAKTAQALVMGGALFTSWVWGGGRWRFPEERRATVTKAVVLAAVGLVGGAALVTETRDSLRFQAQHRLDGLSPGDRMQVLATDSSHWLTVSATRSNVRSSAPAARATRAPAFTRPGRSRPPTCRRPGPSTSARATPAWAWAAASSA